MKRSVSKVAGVKKVEVSEVNITKDGWQMASELRVVAAPTALLMSKGGKIIEQVIGAVDAVTLERKLFGTVK